jgi:hypothetical protein
MLAGTTVKGADGRCGATAASPSTDADLEFLVGLSRQAAVAIENARLSQESQQRAAELDHREPRCPSTVESSRRTALIDLVGEQVRHACSNVPTLPTWPCSTATTAMVNFP